MAAIVGPFGALLCFTPLRFADGQEWSRCPATTLSEEGLDRLRLAQLDTQCADSTPFLVLRSVSTQLNPSNERRLALVGLSVHAVSNSALPFSLNDGALWAGKGLSIRISGGAYARLGCGRAK